MNDKPAVNIIQNGEDQEENKDVHSCHFYSTQFGSPCHGNQRRKRNKRIQVGKEEVKLSLFGAGDTTQKILKM